MLGFPGVFGCSNSHFGVLTLLLTFGFGPKLYAQSNQVTIRVTNQQVTLDLPLLPHVDAIEVLFATNLVDSFLPAPGDWLATTSNLPQSTSSAFFASK